MTKKRKGFIGPIGDDIPSLMMIVLSMTLFFSSILFVFNSYTEKTTKIRAAEGAIEVARTLTSGIIFEDNREIEQKVDRIEESYGIVASYGIAIDKTCEPKEYSLVYFVADKANKPAKLVLCVHSK